MTKVGVSSDLFVCAKTSHRQSIHVPASPIATDGVERGAGCFPGLEEHTEHVIAELRAGTRASNSLR